MVESQIQRWEQFPELTVNRKYKPTVRRYKHEKYAKRFIVPRVQAGGGSISIRGCFSAMGTGCSYIYMNRINQIQYLDELENAFLPSIQLLVTNTQRYIYQQDNAPCHEAKSIAKWFEENKVEVSAWPGRSPDLNPIEQIWNINDEKLVKEPFHSMIELERAIFKFWNDIRYECPNLYCSHRIDARAN